MSDLGDLSQMFRPEKRKQAMAEDMREAALLKVLKAEEETATAFYDSEIATDQTEAMRRYKGEPYGDEVEGRSSVVSRETYETMAWLIPDIRRTFASGKTIVELDAQNPQDDEYVEDAADFLNRIFFVDNPGAKNIKTFAFDGCLSKVGFIGAYFRPGELSGPETIEGMNTQQAMELMDDQTVELEEEPKIEQQTPDEAHPDGVFVRVKFRRRKEGRFESVVRPPETMVISGRATDIDSARMVGCDIEIMVSDLIAMFPDQEDLILENAPSADSVSPSEDERKEERYSDEEGRFDDDEAATELTRTVTLKERYIRYDFDEDGHAELRAVFRLANAILSNEEVDEHPYSCWTPHPISHKLYGQSEHDVIKDIEKLKTTTTRYGQDALYQAVLPRVIADATTVNLSDLLSPRAGGVIRNDGPIANALDTIQIPDVTGSAQVMSEYWDKVAERRTGVTRRAQAFDPDALHETAKGQQLIDNAASVQKEERIFEFKLGLEHHFGKLYRLVCHHLQQARQIRLKGRDVVIDPRKWRKEITITVNPGPGAGARNEKLTQLSWLQAQQEKLIAALGGDNPIVTPRQVFNLIEEGCRVIGYGDGSAFFTEPPEAWRPPPQPSPEMAKVEAQKEAKQAELQMKAQADAAEAQREQAKMQQEAALEERKLQMEMQLKREQIAAELQLKREQMMAEMALKREMAAVDAEVKRMLAAKGVPSSGGGRANGSGGGSQVHVGGDPG